MSVVKDGVLQQTSVTQVDLFGNCPLAWWFQSVNLLRPDMGAAAIAGDSGHNLFAMHLRGEALPTRAQMLKAVKGAILKGELPTPGPDLMVELRGDGQEKYSKYTCECRHPNSSHGDDGKGKCRDCDCAEQKPLWLPLRKDLTLWIGGLPWELFIDLTHRRDDVPEVLDHKFKSKELLHTAKHGHELIDTVQMPVYVRAMMRRWPDAKRWKITHHYVARTGVESFMRSAIVTVDQVLEREATIAKAVEQMKGVAAMSDQADVPFKKSWCEKGPIGLGCPHQSICRAYKEKKVQLTPEEEALFNDLDGKNPSSASHATAVTEVDEEAKLKAEYEAKLKAAKDAKEAKAKLEADAKAKADAEAKAAAAGKTPDPIPDPTATGEQPGPSTAKGKGKAPAASTASLATVTLTVDLATFDRIRPHLK